MHVAAERGTDGGANLLPDQGIVSMRQVLGLDVERAKVGLLLALRLLLGLRECHLQHTWGYGWTAPHASNDRACHRHWNAPFQLESH